MAMIESSDNYDFDANDLGYKLKRTLLFFSSQGGVFSIDFKIMNPEESAYLLNRNVLAPANFPEKIKVGNHSFPALVVIMDHLDIYENDENDDGSRREYDHETDILRYFSRSIRTIIPFDPDDNDCMILTVEIDSSNFKALPPLGEPIELIDSNEQSIHPIFIGTVLSPVKGLTTCFFAVPHDQERIPVLRC
jgi:hypothetical protein